MSTTSPASSTPSFIQRPLHALCRAQHRSYTSPHLVRQKASDPNTHQKQEQHMRKFAETSRTLSRKAQSFSEGVEPNTAERLGDIDIFLGGSCNPTTWRHDIAIPLLEATHVKYFNPQVEEWYEELIHIETRAKETAKIVLMVIDGLTRSIVCINESVEYICRGRRVVLVIEDIQPGTEVEGKVLSTTELADLNGARECLRNLAIKKNIRLYADVATAVEGAIAWMVDDHLTTHIPEVPRLRKRSSIILNEWSGQFRPRRNTSRSCSSTSIVSVVGSTGRGDDADDEQQYSPTNSIVKHLGCQLYGKYTGGSIYLGGNVKATSWREKVAIPLLHQAGIPFYIPYLDYLSFGLSRQSDKPMASADYRWQEIEAEKDDAELILFVIPDHSRSIASMTEAVELVSSRHAVLLVIEPFEEGFLAEDGSRIEAREFKDLARARAYLREMAERNDIEVFTSVRAAVESIVERLE